MARRKDEVMVSLSVLQDSERSRAMLQGLWALIRQGREGTATEESELYLEWANEDEVLTLEPGTVQEQMIQLERLQQRVEEQPVGALWMDVTVEHKRDESHPLCLQSFMTMLNEEDTEWLALRAMWLSNVEGPRLFVCAKGEKGVVCGEVAGAVATATELEGYPFYSHGKALDVQMAQPEKLPAEVVKKVKQLCGQINHRYCDDTAEYGKKSGKYRFVAEDLKFEDAEGLLFFTDRVAELLQISGVNVQLAETYYSVEEEHMSLLQLEFDPQVRFTLRSTHAVHKN